MPRHFGWESFAFGFGPRGVFWAGPRRRRRQWFESGDMKYVILKLLKDKPRHGYEVMKELEDQLRGCYTPSAGTVYPTLQLLEDEGLVTSREVEGKKIYEVTDAGHLRAGPRHRGTRARRRDGRHEPRRGPPGQVGVPGGLAVAR